MKPGGITFTVIPDFANSFASDLLKPFTPDFAAT